MPNIHEILRNLELLRGAGLLEENADAETQAVEIPPPRLYPGEREREAVDRFLAVAGESPVLHPLVCLAPGTVWKTKQWPAERYAALAGKLAGDGFTVVLIGSAEDTALCSGIALANPDARIVDSSGRLSVLESAELIGRSRLLICNDSAPLHIANAMDTPVVAIFGATIPGFGFGPIGPRDSVVETVGLACRPCSIHGGSECPVGTFDCMENITVHRVREAAMKILPESER